MINDFHHGPLGVRVGDMGLLERAKNAYRNALDEFDGDWPAWHVEVVRKNLDGVVDSLRQRRIESPSVSDSD